MLKSIRIGFVAQTILVAWAFAFPMAASGESGSGAKGLSFVNDILPVLSKAGCNAGSCHSKPEGQNGFKLSVFAYDPQSDYQEIVKASRGRRIFPAAPDSSLFLLKPTMTVNHGGGKRLEKDSESYRLLVRWIQEGLPFDQPGEPQLNRIEVTPAEQSCPKESKKRLKVAAFYSDGSQRDVTALAGFSSNEKEIAQVDDTGTVRVGTVTGEGAVVVRYMGMVAVSRVTVPADNPLPAEVYAGLPRNNSIDDLVYARLQKLGIRPSAGCTDAEFIRRAYLDTVGTLPSPERVRRFIQDQSSGKRLDLINEVLANPAYGDFWATKWGDLIRPNPFRVGIKPVYLLDLWLRDSFRANKPYDKMIREILTAEGSTHKYGPMAIFRDRREPIDAATMVSQIFLGTRLECAKCHHHPNEKWSQTDFYQFAAIFSQLKRKGQGISTPISGEAEFIYHAPGGEIKHPVTRETMKPVALDGKELEIKSGGDPRKALADWMTRPENPLFSRAIANRIWAEFMGRGIVEPVDDFRSSNLASNEPLLDWLAQDFVRHQFDLKHLMRTIMQSRTYQLSSLPNDTNKGDTRNYARAYRRRLSAEVLLDAVSNLTETTESLDGLAPGSRAMEAWNQRIDSEFMDAFGRPNSSADCPCERDSRSSVVQALHLMNSNRLQAKIADANGRAKRLATATVPVDEIASELYLAAYGRKPAEDELRIIAKAYQAPNATRQSATEDVMWALINSAEFIFNH